MEQGEGGDGPRGVSWLIYDAQHRVMICRTHDYAIPNIDGHLKDQHRDINGKARTVLVRSHEEMKTRGPADLRVEPHRGQSNPAKAVEGLPILPGFACRYDGCEFLTVSWKCLKVHFNKTHGIRGAKDRLALRTRVSLQTFFTGPQPAVRYFCVTETAKAEAGTSPAQRLWQRERPADDEDLVTEIKQRWMQDQEQQEEMQKVLADGAAKHEITNWLKRSGWTAHFAGRDLGEIYAYSRMPGPGEREARRLVASVDRLFFDRCVGGLKSMPLMTRLLLANPHPEDAHSRPFGPLQEKTSMDRYIGYWKRFLCYCLRVLPLDQAALRTPRSVPPPSPFRPRATTRWPRSSRTSGARPSRRAGPLSCSTGSGAATYGAMPRPPSSTLPACGAYPPPDCAACPTAGSCPASPARARSSPPASRPCSVAS